MNLFFKIMIYILSFIVIRRLMQDKVFTPRTNATHERLMKL